MKLSSALELQAEVFRKIFQFEELPAAAVEMPGVQPTFINPRLMGSDSIRPSVFEDIALGIGAGNEAGETKLSVLVQNPDILASALIDQISELARREVEVSYIGKQEPLWTRARNRPLRMGCSTSPSALAADTGTLGCFCRDIQTGSVGILSNNHVLAGLNQLPIGAPIMQQGAIDRGHPVTDVIASLKRYVPIQFGGIPNLVDAAFATLDEEIHGIDTLNIYDGGNPPRPVMTLQPDQVATLFPGVPVYKTGRTTAHTVGSVHSMNVNNYIVSMGTSGIARFDGQVMFEMANSPPSPFSAPGDSGSLIVDASGAPMALLFAGSQSGGAGNLGITAGNPISSVKAQLAIELI